MPIALELDVATWAFEVMKIARTKTADLFRQLHSDLVSDKEEGRVEVERFLDIIHRSCDEYEGLTGQKTLAENINREDLAEISAPNPSDTVKAFEGTASVSEAAAIKVLV